jgi:hypothetical protein
MGVIESVAMNNLLPSYLQRGKNRIGARFLQTGLLAGTLDLKGKFHTLTAPRSVSIWA